MPARGRLIAFEGGERSGKTTQARVLAEHLGALLTHEPGATRIGNLVRQMLLDPAVGSVDERTEALLLAADRAEHVAMVVRPALASGRWVITDRFSGSSLAYQGFGRGIDLGELARLSSWAARELWPDLSVLIDVPVAVALARGSATPDRIEAEDAKFHERVVEGYRMLAHSAPERWVVVDGTPAPHEVSVQVIEAVQERLGCP